MSVGAAKLVGVPGKRIVFVLVSSHTIALAVRCDLEYQFLLKDKDKARAEYVI